MHGGRVGGGGALMSQSYGLGTLTVGGLIVGGHTTSGTSLESTSISGVQI